MFPFEKWLSPSTTPVLSADDHWISPTVLGLLGTSPALVLPEPVATSFLLDDAVQDVVVIIARSETATEKAVSESPVDSKVSSSTTLKTESTVSPAKSSVPAESQNTATLTSVSIPSESSKNNPPTTSIALPATDSHGTSSGKGQHPQTSTSRNTLDPSSSTITGSISKPTPTGHWIPVSIPTALASGGGLYEPHSKVFDDGYRQGYNDGCYDKAYATHPASLGGDYYTGYRKGRDSGIRDCRPLNGNNQGGSGWSDNVLLPSQGSDITLALWLLVMPCVLAFMLHML